MKLNKFYDDLNEKLKAISKVKLVDWYLDQDITKGGIPISPAVFINFRNVDPKELNNASQEIGVIVEVILFTKYVGVGKKMSGSSEHFLIEEKIHEEMSYLKLEQVGFDPLRKEDKLMRSSLTYQCKYVTALPKKTAANKIKKENVTVAVTT